MHYNYRYTEPITLNKEIPDPHCDMHAYIKTCKCTKLEHVLSYNTWTKAKIFATIEIHWQHIIGSSKVIIGTQTHIAIRSIVYDS